MSNLTSPLLQTATVLFLALSALPAHAAEPWCEAPTATDVVPRASDCLFILRASVGTAACASCGCDVDGDGTVVASDALDCLRAAVESTPSLGCAACPTTTSTTTTSTTSTTTSTTTTAFPTTTTTLPLGPCPDVVEWTTYEARGPACTTNADCATGSCDPESLRCTTATAFDLGWDGTAHDQTLNGESKLRVRVACSPQPEGGCGTCEILGIDPSAGSCRCRSDYRQTCDEPFANDADDCRICADGDSSGNPCDDDGDCDATPCARRCTNDRSKLCSTDEECGAGTCSEQPRCATGATCAADADCISTCTAAASCRCFDGAPQPLATPGYEACTWPLFESDVRGTVNVDTGESAVVKERYMAAFFTEATGSPCPYCGGVCEKNSSIGCLDDVDCEGAGSCVLDGVAGDGERGGTCLGTSDAPGASCDVQSVNSTYPLGTSRGPAGYSLDCLRPAGRLGAGCFQGTCPLGRSIVRATETTGEAALESNLSCGGSNPDLLCPCLLCSADLATSCNSNAECATQRGRCSGDDVFCDSNSDCADSPDAGPCVGRFNGHCLLNFSRTRSSNADCESTCVPSTCSAYQGNMSPKPNACSDGLCTDLGGGSGECTNGPIDKRCDGVLTMDGRGVVACSSNTDCEAAAGCEDGGCSTCTLTQPRSCFPAPILDTGVADPRYPVTTSAFCQASFGPSLVRRQNVLRAYCSANPDQLYVPGSGGCSSWTAPPVEP